MAAFSLASSSSRSASRKSSRTLLHRAGSVVVESLERRTLLSAPATFNPVGVGGTGAVWWARVNPQNASEVYASTDMGQVWHTTNGGTSWTTMKDIIGEASLSCVQFSGTAGTAFGVGTGYDAGGNGVSFVSKTIDSGATWARAAGWDVGTHGWNSSGIQIQADSSSNRLLVAENLGSGMYRVWFSNDAGATFTKVDVASHETAGSYVCYLAGAFWDSSNIYFATNQGVYSSANGGTSWSTYGATGINFTNEGIVSFAGSRAGSTTRLYTVTWAQSAFQSFGDLNTLGSMGPDYRGIYSSDNGAAWTSRAGSFWGYNTNQNMVPLTVCMISNNISQVWVSGGDYNNYGTAIVNRADDGGVSGSWTRLFKTGYGSWSASESPNQNIKTDMVGTGSERYDWGWAGGVLSMTAQWNPAYPSDLSKMILAVTDVEVFTTTDAGTGWKSLMAPETQLTPAGQLTNDHKYVTATANETNVYHLAWTDPQNVFAACTDFTGMQSNDDGMSWMVPTYGANTFANTYYDVVYDWRSGYLYAVTSNAHDLYKNDHFSDGYAEIYGSDRVVVSYDRGQSWNLIHDFGAAVSVKSLALDPRNPNRLFVALANHHDTSWSDSYGTYLPGGIYYTNDLSNGSGSTWTRLAHQPMRDIGAGPEFVGCRPEELHVLNNGDLVGVFTQRYAGGYLKTAGMWVLPHDAAGSPDVNASWIDASGNLSTDGNLPNNRLPYYTIGLTIDPNDSTQNTWYATTMSPGTGWYSCAVYKGTYDPATHTVNWTTWLSAQNPVAPLEHADSQPWKILIRPGTTEMFMAMNYSGVYYTADYTVANPTFTRLNLPFGKINNMAIDTFNPDKLWIGTYGAGAFWADISTTAPRPSAVSGVSGSCVGGTVTVNWNAVAGISGYRVQYTDNSRSGDQNTTANWTSVNVSAGTTTWSSSSLPYGSYYFRVVAYNASGVDSPISNYCLVPKYAAVPITSATGLSTSSMVLKWTDNAVAETSFDVQYSADGVNWTAAPSAGPNTTGTTISGLLANTQYWFHVRAVNGSSSGDWSNPTVAGRTNNLSGLSVAESFEYPLANLGTSANQGLGWAGPWSIGNPASANPQVLSGSLTSGGLWNVGNRLSITTEDSLSRTLASPIGGSGTLWASYLLKVDFSGGSTWSGGMSVNGTEFGVPGYPAGFKFGVVNNSANLYADSGVVATAGQTYLLVLEITSGPTDTVDLYVNPNPGDAAPSINPGINIIHRTGVTHIAGGTSISLSHSYYAVPNFDEIRIGANYSDVTPLPVPASPTGPGATGQTTQIVVNWTDASSTESGFHIQRATDANFTQGLTTFSAAANAQSYTDTTASSGVTYYYRISSYNNTGDSVYSGVVSASLTSSGAPIAPSNLSATAASSSQINVSWTDNSNNETGFYLDRATDSGFSANLVTTTLGANVTTSSATGLSASTTYYFRVRAYNAGGSSANTSTASATTQAATGGLVASDGFGGYTIGGALNGQGTSGSGWASGWTVTGDSPSSTTVVSGDITPPVSLQVSGNAHGSLGASGSTATRTLTSSLNGHGSTLWASALITTNWSQTYRWGNLVVGNVTVQYHDRTGNQDYEWTINGTDGSWYGSSWSTGAMPAANNTTYFIVVKEMFNGGSDSVRVWVNPAPGATDPSDASAFDSKSSVNVGGSLSTVSFGGSYYANTQFDELRLGTTYADVAPVGITVPPAPSNLAATAASQTQINVSWTDNSSNETGFYLDRATDSGFTANLVTTTLGANVTTSSATGLTANTTYYFRVRAYNGAGSSANTTTSSATTLPNAPTAPSGLTTSVVSQTQINTTWTDNSSNETGFYLDRATDSGFSANLVTTTLGANVTSSSATGLTANTTYYFRVRAYNAGGSSANTSTASATTLPNAPTAPSALTATAASSSQINVSWTDNSSNETGFYLDRATDSGFTVNLVTGTLGTNVTTSSATGLSAATTYYFRVRAYNAGGSSANSSTASATTQVSFPSDGFGGYTLGVLNGQGTAGNGWAGSWSVTGDNPASTTVVSGDLAAPVALAVSGNAHGSLGTTNSTATRNTSGSLSSYGSTIWASALMQTNWTGAYQWGSLTIGNVTVQYRDYTGSSTVEWTMNGKDGSWYGTSFNTGATPAANNTTYFVVMKMTYNGGSDSVRVWLNPAPGSTPPLDAASFDYKTGVNAGGALSNVAFCAPYYANMQFDELRIGMTYADVAPVGTLQAPAAPSTLSASASSSSQVNLSWTDNATNENGFYIDRATNSTFTTNLVTYSVAANATSFNATALVGGTTYYFRVRAYNGAGSSANSSTASATTMAAPAMPAGLKALWRFDEGSGTTANDTDTDGTADSGTLNGSPTWATGKIGKGLTLNGTNQYVQAANSTDLNISGSAFSTGMWVKSGATNWNSTQTFISKGNGYKFGGVSGGKNIQFSLYIGGAWKNLTYTNSGDISTNWHHYAATYDGANMRIWVDGTNVASMAQTGSIASNTSVLYLGRISSSYLNGSVDEVRVYNSVLSSADVTNLYNQAALSVTGLTVNSGNSASYSVQNYALATGISQYGDQTKNFTTIPSKYLGSTLIRTAFADNTSTASSLLSFTINQPVLLYVAFDDAITSKPAWLTASFTDTTDNIVTAQGTFSVYKLAVSSGTITLGGPGGLASQGMYNVFYQNLL